MARSTLLSLRKNGVAIMLGVGNGEFRHPVVYPAGGYYQGSLAVGDLNGDGFQDIVVTGSTTESSILLGNGDGTFKSAINLPGIIGDYVALGDFNHDGVLDLALLYGAAVSIVLGNGDATFQSPMYFAASGEPPSLTVAALTRDGKPDIVLPDEDGHISVLLNTTPQ
jgi:hypothetical protein